MRNIRVIALTHLHGDHCLGLPGVLQRISLKQPPHPVTVIYPKEGQEYVDRLYQASIYCNQADIRFLPVAASNTPHEVFRTDHFVLSAASLRHRVPTIGYRVEDPDDIAFDKEELEERDIRSPMVGTLRREGQVEVGGRVTTLAEVTRPRDKASFAFVMDSRPCREAELLAQGVDLMVMEATYTEESAQLAIDHAHSTAGEAGQVAAAAQAKKLALTHFSTRYADTSAHVAEAGAHHPDVVALADLDRIQLTRSQPKSQRP